MSILSGLGGTIGHSNGMSSSIGQSYGSSSNYGYNYGESSSWENSYSDSWNESENSSWNITHGREASAQDIYRAMEANEQQKENWLDQAMYNSYEAEKNRLFQMKMSNTAYQRAVKDLLKAGLNPILAVGNMGASTPTGATASSGLSTSHKATTYAQSEGGSYGYSRGGSHSESHAGSKSSSYGENWGSSSESSYNRSISRDMSRTSNNIAEIGKTTIQGLTDVYSSGSANKLYNALTSKMQNLTNRVRQHSSGRTLTGGKRKV